AVLLLFGCAQAFNTEGLNLVATGQYSQAISTLEPPDRDYRNQPFDKVLYLCMAYVEARRLDAVFDCLDAAQEKVDAGEYVADLWNHSGTVPTLKAQAYLEIGDHAAAVRSAEQAMSVIDAKGLATFDRIKALGVLGLAYQKNGRTGEAARIKDELLNFHLSFVESLLHEDLLAARARMLLAMGDYETAANLEWTVFRDPIDVMARGIAGQDIFNSTTLPFLYMQAKSNLESGNHETAKKKYAEIMALNFDVAEFSGIYHYLLYDRAILALHDGDRAKAVELLKQSVDSLEKTRRYLTTDASRIGFAQDKQSTYAVLIRTLVENGDAAQAFEYAERGKARALVDLLAGKDTFGGRHDPARIAATLSELDRLEQESLKLASAADPGLSRGIDATRRDMMDALPETASLVAVSTERAETVGARLRPDEALIEYFYHAPQGRDASELYAFVVTRGGVAVHVLDGRGLHGDVQKFRAAINAYRTDDWVQWSAKLHRRLVEPLERNLSGINHLTLVPHGVLHYLPFNALRTGTGTHLIERFTLRLLPSASVLQFLDKGGVPTQGLLVFGNPDLGNPSYDLPGAEAEARAIAQSWPNSKVVLRKHASETVMKTAAGAFKYLHLASHGQFNPDQPMQSRMLLAPDAENDGSLTVPEIFDLRLGADMVVLSACQTGLGDVKNGDDVVGLNRGFLYAGAKSIVSSLWEVPDEPTKDLMLDLYRNLKTMDMTVAMQKAQIAALRKYKHPVSWAAFQATGGN
ncbi:MAG: CHAT domain-containing protein, partial [Alphaproteobacteria bacterium]|nr:CHAT domain-containing protein [Alphaproteobacteria bacterium]